MIETNEVTTSTRIRKFFQGRNLYITIAGFILISMIAGYWYWTKTPQYSLRYVAKAIETHDLTLFEKYVDMDSLLSRAVDQFMDYKSSDANDSIDSSVKRLAQGFVQLMKPQLVMSVKEQIKAYIEKGDFDKQVAKQSPENTKQTKNQDINFGELYTNIGGGGIRYKGVEYTKTEGKIAVVGIKLYFPKLEADVILDIKMRERDGYWQVVEFSNLSAFMQNIDKLEKEKIAKLNEPIIAEMNQSLVFPDVKINKKFKDMWGITKSISLGITAKNQTNKTITDMTAHLVIKNTTNGNVVWDRNIQFGEKTPPIPPGKSNWYIWTWDINSYIDKQQTFWDTPKDNMQIDIIIKSIKFDDGTELKLVEKLS